MEDKKEMMNEQIIDDTAELKEDSKAGENAEKSESPVKAESAEKAEKTAKPGKSESAGKWWSGAVTKKFMAAGLAATILINAGVTAGVMALMNNNKSAMKRNRMNDTEMFSKRGPGGNNQMGPQNNGQMGPPQNQSSEGTESNT